MIKQSMDWISVKDRLPVDDGEVIGITKGGDYYIVIYWGQLNGFVEKQEFMSVDITHWMPLPELPA